MSEQPVLLASGAPFGDYLVLGYTVSSERAEITFRCQRREDGEPRHTEVTFVGVVAYRFEHDDFGTILTPIIDVPLAIFLARHASSSLEPDDLARIEALCSAATPGPWTSFIEGRDHESGSDFIQTTTSDIEMSGATHADQDFIASARQDLPALVLEVRRLRKLLERWRAGK